MSETNQPPDAGEDDKVDEAVEETFPASDPPSTGGSTGPNDIAGNSVLPEPGPL